MEIEGCLKRGTWEIGGEKEKKVATTKEQRRDPGFSHSTEKEATLLQLDSGLLDSKTVRQ